MWLWEAESENHVPRSDADITSDVKSLRSWFREYRTRDPRHILGYGRCWTRFSSKPYPLILLNSAERYSHGWYWAWADLFRGLRGPRPIEQTVSEELRRSLDLPKTGLPLFVFAISEPEPSTTIAQLVDLLRPIRNGLYSPATETMGSAGVSVKLADGSLGILSAGHVFPEGEGSDVRLINGFTFWKRTQPLGKVEHHSVPIGAIAGWDVAIIRAHSPFRAPPPAKTRWPSVRQGYELTYAKGARSGFVDTAVLIAGLEEVSAAPLSWSCCWLIGPSTALVRGDSGASVFVRKTGELLGTYVGTARVGTGEAFAAFVQDAYSVQQNVLSNWNVSF